MEKKDQLFLVFVILNIDIENVGSKTRIKHYFLRGFGLVDII